MDSIPYRKSKILIKTIPKGTLLFRLTGYPKNDLRGVPKKDGTRCILSNHNVFFYPNPFVGNIALYKFKDTDLEHLAVFVLKNDIKVIWLLNPSKYSRVSKNTKRNFLKRCSTVRQGCLDRKIISRGLHAKYNPCLSDTIIKKYMFYYLQSIQPELLSIAKGMAQLGINQENFYKIKIPIPSMEKQLKIVEYLDFIYDNVIKKNIEKIEDIKKLNKYYLSLNISFNTELEIKTLGEVCKFDIGGTPLTNKNEYYNLRKKKLLNIYLCNC